MRVGNFSLLVVGGREVSSGHVRMKHGDLYSLRLGNHGHRRCDAVVTIDGKDMGTYRVHSDSFIMLERSQLDNGRFTFFLVNSDEAIDALVHTVESVDRGLIQVRFRPEKNRPSYSAIRGRMPTSEVQAYGDARPRDGRCWKSAKGGVELTSAKGGVEAGITGLTGHSDQQFVNVEDIEWSPEDEVVISVRLVADTRETVRPLQGVKSNPVPRPI